MEVALPFLAHMAFLMVGLGSIALAIALLTRSAGVKQYIMAPALLAFGIWLLHSAVVRL